MEMNVVLSHHKRATNGIEFKKERERKGQRKSQRFNSSPHVSRLLHVVEGKVHFGIFTQRAAKMAHR